MPTVNVIELKNSFVKDIKFRKGVTKAADKFKESKPFKGTRFERLAKLDAFHRGLCKVYEVVDVPIRITLKGMQKGWHVSDTDSGLIVAGTPKPAVWSYLYAFSELVFDECKYKNRVRWSLNLYRRMFPKMFEKLVPTGNMLLAFIDADESPSR